MGGPHPSVGVSCLETFVSASRMEDTRPGRAPCLLSLESSPMVPARSMCTGDMAKDPGWCSWEQQEQTAVQM